MSSRGQNAERGKERSRISRDGKWPEVRGCGSGRSNGRRDGWRATRATIRQWRGGGGASRDSEDGKSPIGSRWGLQWFQPVKRNFLLFAFLCFLCTADDPPERRYLSTWGHVGFSVELVPLVARRGCHWRYPSPSLRALFFPRAPFTSPLSPYAAPPTYTEVYMTHVHYTQIVTHHCMRACMSARRSARGCSARQWVQSIRRPGLGMSHSIRHRRRRQRAKNDDHQNIEQVKVRSSRQYEQRTSTKMWRCACMAHALWDIPLRVTKTFSCPTSQWESDGGQRVAEALPRARPGAGPITVVHSLAWIC